MIHSKGSSSSFGDGESVGGDGVIKRGWRCWWRWCGRRRCHHSIRSSSSLREDGGEGVVGGDGVGGDGVIHSMNEASSSFCG